MFLEINGIKKSFGEGDSLVEVLKGIDLSVEKGEFCVLLGPSGSGKSTLLNIIGGIDRADAGSITINGEKTEDMNEKRLTAYRRKHLGYIFQMYNLIPNLTVQENIEVGAYLSDHPLDVEELIETLGLTKHRRKLPNQLSGGQQQRCAIGRERGRAVKAHPARAQGTCKTREKSKAVGGTARIKVRQHAAKVPPGALADDGTAERVRARQRSGAAVGKPHQSALRRRIGAGACERSACIDGVGDVDKR